MGTLTFISGLHLIQFRHWSLRWLHFGLGLTGCVLIATDFLFWLESRRKRYEQLRLKGVGFVEGMTIGSVSGIVIATFVFFVVNRLLPLNVTFLGQEPRWRSGPSISGGSQHSLMPGCDRRAPGLSSVR